MTLTESLSTLFSNLTWKIKVDTKFNSVTMIFYPEQVRPQKKFGFKTFCLCYSFSLKKTHLFVFFKSQLFFSLLFCLVCAPPPKKNLPFIFFYFFFTLPRTFCRAPNEHESLQASYCSPFSCLPGAGLVLQ